MEAAFQWLEALPPPLIIAPSARRAVRTTLFVPNNDSDRKPERQERLTGKSPWPHHLLDGDTVHFVWPMAEKAARNHAESVAAAGRDLLALGWGIDQVVGNGRILDSGEVAALSGTVWRAWEVVRPGGQTRRVPTTGTLGDLERVHHSFLQRVEGRHYRPPKKLDRFEAVSYLRADTVPPRSYAVFDLPQGVAFQQESTATVAAMLRSLACRHSREDTHRFPGGSEAYVAGHVRGKGKTPPRFSYLPLPTIGHQHSDGMIRRLLIAEPLGGDGRHAQWATARLGNAELRDKDGHHRGILSIPWRPSTRAMLGRYVDRSRTWSSVTPVVLPGYDDGRHAKAEKLLLMALVQAELPVVAIEELAVRKAPYWPGSSHSRRYVVPKYLQHFPRWHVWLRFREGLPGPFAVGAGRHAGLGLLARWGGASV